MAAVLGLFCCRLHQFLVLESRSEAGGLSVKEIRGHKLQDTGATPTHTKAKTTV